MYSERYIDLKKAQKKQKESNKSHQNQKDQKIIISDKPKIDKSV